MYKQLYKEHLNLQRSFSALYRLFSVKNGGGLEKYVLRWLQEKERLERIAGYFQMKVDTLERELQESQERSELLEFCLLENLAKIPGAEDVVDEGVNTDPCCLHLGDHRTCEYSGVTHYSCVMTSPGEQNLGSKSRHPESEDPGGGDWTPMDHIKSAVLQLQSLVEWTSQRKGAKEESSVVKQKLQQLDKIRKELEQSARDSRCFQIHADSQVTGHHSSVQLDVGNSSKQGVVDSSENSDKTIQSNTVFQESQNLLDDQSPARDRCVTFRANTEELDSSSLSCEGQETCDFPTTEKDLSLYIDFVSAKEQIQQLTMNLETEENVKGTRKGGRHADEIEEPDSLGTVISEDEGLGEESRRADSMGSNSFLDMHVSQEDLVDSATSTSSVRETEGNVPEEKSDSVWIDDPQDPRISLELCRCTIYKLKESLRSREDQLKQLKSYRDSANEVINLQNIVSKLKTEIEELKQELKGMEQKNANLQEQVLELEEAENDSRRQCQRLEENLIFLQEKDSHFQVELAETKHALELCVERLAVKETNQKELCSQMKYMEVLIHKYEDQIRDFEILECALKEKLAESEILRERNVKNQEESLIHKGTQTYSPRSVQMKRQSHTVEETTPVSLYPKTSESLTKSVLNLSWCGEDKSSISCFKSVGTQDSSLDYFNERTSRTESLVETGIQTDLTTMHCDRSKDHSTQTEQTTLNEMKTGLFPDEGKLPLWFTDASDLSNISSEAILNSPCPFQKELFNRLHHLVQEDANLQQQLHHMDQINLTLWKKLHNLESHIGECKKENFDHLQPSQDEISSNDSAISAVLTEFVEKVIPQALPLSTGNAKPFDAGEEEHFVSNGKSIHFDCNEVELRERLSQLEKINSSFEAELAQREKLHSERELKHKEWVESENLLISELRNLEKAKNSLLATVAHLETERHQLESKLKIAEDELLTVQDRNSRQISQMTAEHEALISEFEETIATLSLREKEYLAQITNLRLEKKSLLKKDSATGELDKLKISYVQLQLELNEERNIVLQMESDFGDQLETLRRQHLVEEKRLEDEIRRLKEKQNDFNEQINTYQRKQSELEETVLIKEQELENARLQFRDHMTTMEEEHKSVENELNKKLRQMEESTAFATRALTEEKIRLEKDLQENIYDLRSKEELYKCRIAELETNVTQLHQELGRLTGDLDSGLSQYQGSEFPQFQKERLQKQLQELQCREEELREKLEEMEQKEAAYRETLENADRIVATVERGYKNKIEELEMSERSLKQRVTQLEEVENRLRIALHRERRSSDGRKPDDLVVELLEAEVRENALKEQVEFLEQSQRTASQKLKELEKIREKLEAQLCDQEELVASLKRMQQEQEAARKDIANLRKSENELREGLQQAEALIRSKDSDMQTEMKRMQEEKRDFEETIHQLRMQVRQLQSIVDCDQEEEGNGETLGETVVQSPQSVKCIPDTDDRSQEVMALAKDVESWPTGTSPEEKESDVSKNFTPFPEGEEIVSENATINKIEVEALKINYVYRYIDDSPRLSDSGITQDKIMISEREDSSKQDVRNIASMENEMKSAKAMEETFSDLEEGFFGGLFQEPPPLEAADKGLYKSVSILQVIQNLKKEKEDSQDIENKVKDLQVNVNETLRTTEGEELFQNLKSTEEKQAKFQELVENSKEQPNVVPEPEAETPEKNVQEPRDEVSASNKNLEISQCGDECSKACKQLEECMIRAMVAMEFDIHQKKASQRLKADTGREISSPTAITTSDFQGQRKEDSANVGEPFHASQEKAAVESPFNFRIVQQVGSDTLLVGWEHSRPPDLEGFEVYVDGALHETVYTPDRTKAVISGVDLSQPLTLSVCAISRVGGVSQPQVLHLPQHSSFSNDGFFFLDDEDDDDDVLFGEDEPMRQTRPYSMEW